MSPVIQIKDESKLLSCIVPFYRVYKKMHSNYNSLNLAIIGAIRPHQKDKDLSLLMDLLKIPNLKLNVYIFMRKMDWKVISNRNKFLRENPNIKFFPGLSTEKMIEKLKEVKFILPLSQQGGWFYWQRLTGTIPLAINLNIPLILDKKLAKIYNLEDCGLLYENKISEILESIISISEENYYQIIENSFSIFVWQNRKLLPIIIIFCVSIFAIFIAIFKTIIIFLFDCSSATTS
jgi:hypothetical protein